MDPSWCSKAPAGTSFSRVRFFVTPGTVVHPAPLSMGFSRQESWSGLPCPPPGDFPNPGIKSRSPALQGDSLPSEPPGKPYLGGLNNCLDHSCFIKVSILDLFKYAEYALLIVC